MTRFHTRLPLVSALVIVVLAAMSTVAQQQLAQPATPEPVTQGHVWLGPDGNPLPFKTDAEIVDFLRTADVVGDRGIPTGVTGPRRLMLEKNGVRAEAVWRQVNEEKLTQEFGTGPREPFFRDSYIFEPAAYELSRMLGMDNVPPAVLRKYKGAEGSVQIWVEKAMTEAERLKQKTSPPDAISWSKQTHVMNVWDQLVFNTDRNRGNILITPDWKMWLIDHTRAFRRLGYLLAESSIQQCDRGVFEKMKALDEKTLHEHLDPYLRSVEITTLLKRRDKVVNRLNQLIREKGENGVLFTLYSPQGATGQAQ